MTVKTSIFNTLFLHDNKVHTSFDALYDKYYKYIKCIRVDPDKTYVFSSEIRAAFYGKEQIAEINKSKRMK